MSATAGRYFPRSPRYVLNANDQNIMRFAAMNTRGKSSIARLRDLSETGLAFTLPTSPEGPTEGLPDEGDAIKIEFAIPGEKQMACFATVMRVEARTEWDKDWGNRGYTLIALQFRNLPKGHLRSLQISLTGHTSQAQDEQIINDDTSLTSLSRALSLGGAFLLLTLALFLMVLAPQAWLSPFV